MECRRFGSFVEAGMDWTQPTNCAQIEDNKKKKKKKKSKKKKPEEERE